jgi:hypothetical protein
VALGDLAAPATGQINPARVAIDAASDRLRAPIFFRI